LLFSNFIQPEDQFEMDQKIRNEVEK